MLYFYLNNIDRYIIIVIMVDLKYLVNISSRRKYAIMIRDYFLDTFKEKFKKIKHNDLIILHINAFKKNFEKYIKGHLGEVGGSVDAEAYKITINLDKDSIDCALKLIPLINNEAKNIMNLSYKSWKELYILKMIYNLIKNHNCPNVPIIYIYFICKDCKVQDYLNPNITRYYNNLNIRQKIEQKDSNDSVLKRMNRKKGYGTNALCILNELCTSSLKDLLVDTYIDNIDDNIFNSFIFQILSGVYSIHKLCHICHFDLHGGNILVSVIKSNGYWLYNINNEDYYIPNNGYILKIWDFGRSMIINVDEPKDIYVQIIHQCKRFFKDAFKKNPKLEKHIYKKLTKDNLPIILFAFDLWRIISYLYSKFKKETYYEAKFKNTIALLNNIKKDCENNWVLQLINSKTISNEPHIFMNYLLNKYFSNYMKIQKNLINNKKYVI
tara:strand:+ start:603 stop:1919 length:1317 start_codon:yes stop_codon:yes gene_type:complete